MAIIWRVKDGKAGHERQTAGLIKALGSRFTCEIHEITTEGGSPYWQWLSKSFPAIGPKPDLIVGAGSACQTFMLAAQRTHGGKTIYLMRPQFPLRCFDLCIIPTHDSPPMQRNVLKSEGVLNDLCPATRDESGQDVILIGGPSKHHRWNTEQLLTQINELINQSSQRPMLLSTSRRTPVDTVDALAQVEGLDVKTFDSVKSTWLAEVLAKANTAWVTADSISMMYETLSMGVNLGILEVPSERNDRITKVAPTLVSKSYATSFSQWQETGIVEASPQLNESARIALLIEQRFQEIF